MRARAWGLAANSGKNHRQTGTKHGKPAPQSSSVKHSQPRHPPAATLSTSISQHTMKIIFKTNRGFTPLENGQDRLKLEKNIVQVFYEWVICTAGTSHSNFSQLICWFPLFGAFLTARHVFLTFFPHRNCKTAAVDSGTRQKPLKASVHWWHKMHFQAWEALESLLLLANNYTELLIWCHMDQLLTVSHR